MKIKYNYESDADAVVIEILDASVELSKLFNRVVSKEEMKQLLCRITQKPNEYLVQFQSPQKNESANLLISLYKSPPIYNNSFNLCKGSL